jgi:hypothetical protein
VTHGSTILPLDWVTSPPHAVFMQIASEGLKGRVFEVSLADLQKVCFRFGTSCEQASASRVGTQHSNKASIYHKTQMTIVQSYSRAKP